MAGPQGNTVSSPAPEKKVKKDALVGNLLAGKYKIIKKIGEGGMGSVYIANQETIDRKVAVKVLLGKLAEDEIAVKRFEQEARAISKMQHPNTVTIYDFGRTQDDDDDERLYIVMEYLKGKTLTQVLRADGVLAPARASRIMRQVCASLSDAHAAGIIHRDLKPDNIFLTEIGGDKDWVKVLDFGVAKLADSEGAGTLTQTGMIFGTPKYMSPEQAEGRPIDYRADIYALGVVMYELLVGRPPFVADTPVGLLLKHISEPPAPFSRVRPDLQIDPALEGVVMRALDKRPEARQQMVAELAQALEPFERAGGHTGQMSTPMTGRTPLVGGMPTEVVPGQVPAGQLTPSHLQPPNAVPSQGLSLGLPPEGATAAASAQMRPADLMPTAAGRVSPNSLQMTSAGLTHPTPAQGGFETLGGVSGEISGGHLQKPTGKNPMMLYGGIGFLAIAAGVVIFAASRLNQTEALPLTPPPTAVVKTEPPPPVVTPPPPPVIENPPPRDPPVSEKGARRDPPPSDRVRPPPPAVATKVRFNFDSDPDGAVVTLAGKQIGHTPFFEEFVKDGDVLNFTFTKNGYEDGHATFTASRDQKISVKLDKAAVQAPPPPAAKTCPDGSSPPCKVHKVTPPPPPPAFEERVDDIK